MTVRGTTLYYWSSRGPMRCEEGGRPEPLWSKIDAAVASAINAQKVVVSFDEGTDTVLFTYDAGSGVRTLAMFDCTREIWLGPDDDIGIVIRAAGGVAPVLASTAAAVTAPAAAPTAAVTSGVGATVVTAPGRPGTPRRRPRSSIGARATRRGRSSAGSSRPASRAIRSLTSRPALRTSGGWRTTRVAPTPAISGRPSPRSSRRAPAPSRSCRRPGCR
jgi:hypothetical protein